MIAGTAAAATQATEQAVRRAILRAWEKSGVAGACPPRFHDGLVTEFMALARALTEAPDQTSPDRLQAERFKQEARR